MFERLADLELEKVDIFAIVWHSAVQVEHIFHRAILAQSQALDMRHIQENFYSDIICPAPNAPPEVITNLVVDTASEALYIPSRNVPHSDH